MKKRDLWLKRINSVLREYRAARTAADLLLEHVQADPSRGIKLGWKAGDSQAFWDNLSGTYLIRLYAVFEAGLRDYWTTHLNRTTDPPMATLLQTVASRQVIPIDYVDDANDVRTYRNALVHEWELAKLNPIKIDNAKSSLCRYFARLDHGW